MKKTKAVTNAKKKAKTSGNGRAKKLVLVPAVIFVTKDVDAKAFAEGQEKGYTRKYALSRAACATFGVDLLKVSPPTRRRQPWRREDSRRS